MALTNNDLIYTFLGLSTPTAAQIGLISLLRPRVEALIKEFVGYKIEQATYTEYYPSFQRHGSGSGLVEGFEVFGNQVVSVDRYDDRSVLQLKLPLRSLVSVNENPNAWDTGSADFPASTLLPVNSYIPDFEEDGICWSGFLYRRMGSWPAVERSVKVVYVAGLTQAELNSTYPEFQLAALTAIQIWFSQVMNQRSSGALPGGAVTSFSLDGFSVSYDAVSQQWNSGYMHQLPRAAMLMLEQRVRMSKYLGS